MTRLTEKKLDEVTRKILRENINKIKNNGIKEFGFIVMDRKEFNKTIRECLNEMADSTDGIPMTKKNSKMQEEMLNI